MIAAASANVPGTARHDPIKLSVSLSEVLGRSPAGGERLGLSR